METKDLCDKVILLEKAVEHLTESVDARLEKDGDKMDAALILLGRIDEKQSAMSARLSDGSTTMAGHNNRITLLEVAVNHGRGARDVLVWVVGVLQVVGLGIFGYVANSLGSIQGQIVSVESKQVEHRARPHGSNPEKQNEGKP